MLIYNARLSGAGEAIDGKMEPGKTAAGLPGKSETDRECFIATDKDVRINGEINAPEVRLLGPEGQQIGIVSLVDAMRQANEAELDLVEIAPTAIPPVCRVMDYGKFKYEKGKKEK